MLELVPSKDYRKYLEEKQIEISDWDWATLVYNHNTLNYDKRIRALSEIKEKTEDTELQKQIEERLSWDAQAFDDFKKNSGNAYFILYVCYDTAYLEEDVYLEFDSAFGDGMQSNCRYKIEKNLFACMKVCSGQWDLIATDLGITISTSTDSKKMTL